MKKMMCGLVFATTCFWGTYLCADTSYDLDDATSYAAFDAAYDGGTLLGDNITLNYNGATELNYTGKNIVGNNGSTYYTITKTGTGNVKLSSFATICGALTISGGGMLGVDSMQLKVAADDSIVTFGTGGGIFQIGHSNFHLIAASTIQTTTADTSTVNGRINLNGKTLTLNVVEGSTLNVANYTNIGTIEKTGAGTLNLTSTSGWNTENSTDTTSKFKISQGTVVFQKDDFFKKGVMGTLKLASFTNNATANAGATTQTFYNLNGTAATATLTGTGTWNLLNDVDTIYAGTLSGTGLNLNKSGTGSLSIGAVDTSTALGTVTVTGGTLYLAGTANSLGISDGSYSPGTAENTLGSLTLNAANNVVTTGDGQLVVDVTNTNGTLAYDTLVFTNNDASFDMADGSLLFNFVDFQPSSHTVYDLNFLENMTLSAGDYTRWLDPTLSGWRLLANDRGDLIYGSSTALPEPSAWLLLVFGLGLLSRKRVKK